jgi:DNA invertase Pin-like site-specific DNA recombinase
VTARLRVLGYVRRSTDKQGISIAEQTGQLVVAADLQGWDLDLRNEDVASGKSTDDRPVLASAIADLRVGRADVLAVAKLERLARDTADGTSMLRQADREGWTIFALDVQETMSIAGRAQAQMMFVFAEMERRRIGERTREGMARIKAQTGKHMGRPPRIPPEVEARILDLHAADWSASAIARLFNDKGVPKGEGSSPLWNHSHICAAVRRAEVRASAAEPAGRT